MRRAERVVFTLGALGETGKPVGLAQGANTVATSGEDLVGIGLMADIPNDLVVGRIEHIVQRHGEFDDAEPSAQMAARHRHRIDGFLPQLIGQLAQLPARKHAQRGWFIYLVQKGRLGRQTHEKPSRNRHLNYVRRSTTNSAAARRKSAFSSNKSR